MAKQRRHSRSIQGLFPIGSFEYIEHQIRRDQQGNALGSDFERLCKWFLLNAPRYRGVFDRVWLWNEWPDRWGTDAGIDLVARTRSGQLWAIQAKAHHPDRSIPKRELDSFLSESSRSEFSYRLLIASTNDIGRNAQRTLDGQEKPVGFVSRGDLLTEEVSWPTQIDASVTSLPKRTPLPHQKTAIEKVVKGFRSHDRGQLIMACGTGKTLTAMWIAERLKSRRTLVLVPSLSLVAQNLREWGRNATGTFAHLVVCGDESVSDRDQDPTVHSPQALGVPVTTSPAQIRRFRNQKRRGASVVFATYHSAHRIAAAQKGQKSQFDLVICDEAHRCAGARAGAFATALDAKKIKARKRLFMTATPRYFKDHVKRRAAELEYDLVSMDDEHAFGPEFHVLTFHEAISADPPLLTDYQVVVIGVTDREAKAWAEEARLVRTAKGLKTDARTLAAQIGLAKAMSKYNLRRIITFHSSVAKAQRFVDPTLRDSLPGVIPHLSRSARPSGKLWARHISGHTPAGQRATLLKGLGNLSENTRGIISNCACLGEGVDVPVLDGVAFIDPKRSMVDIIQAVGRVIRKAEGKQIGTIVLPVFIDETENADHILSQSAFEPVWQVLKALRAHDRRLADELDQLRLSLGKRSKRGGRIHLPATIQFDVPRLLLQNFEQAFYVRTVERTTDKPTLTFEQILAWADFHKAATGDWPNQRSGAVAGTDETWARISTALSVGLRGLPAGSSLSKLLAKYRGARNHLDLPVLNHEQILAWVDAHKKRTGDWPNRKSGAVDGTDEIWDRINTALSQGQRGLPAGTTLPQFLAEYRGVINPKGLPSLEIDQILAWADVHKAVTGDWPKSTSGKVEGTDETWGRIDNALMAGNRGLPGGSSLAKLLGEHRGRRNTADLRRLTIKQILKWMDAHKAATNEWPHKKSGSVTGTDEKWSIIEAMLRKGSRGLPGNSSLAKLRAEHLGVRNRSNLPPLTIKEILRWMDAHKSATGEWPDINSGKIAGTDANWRGINVVLDQGFRGLPGDQSLARLLAEYRGVKNKSVIPALSIAQILHWMDEHRLRTGKWPTLTSGQVPGTDENWRAINTALKNGNRGLPAGSSLAKLRADRRGGRNQKALPPLSVNQILQWIDEHKAATGEWPKRLSGQVAGTDETWAGINHALRIGYRGLPGNSTLADLLATHRGVRNQKSLPPLTVKQILIWADQHKAATGHWPKSNAGQVSGHAETWNAIDTALSKGQRGLPGGSSLPKLLAKHRSVRNIRNLPPLTIEQILKWVDRHRAETGDWPNTKTGYVLGTEEIWSNVNDALVSGVRSLPGRSSLAKLLAKHRSVRNIHSLAPLTVKQIQTWAEVHKGMTGSYPKINSGQVLNTDEKWSRINDALSKGLRGLPGGSSLAKLLAEYRDGGL